MPRIVLHIGPHKTGTTYIQTRLHENREALRARGVDYWEGGLDGSSAHHRIAEVTRSGDEAALSDLLQPLESVAQEVVILSSENFDLLRGPGVRRLKAALPAGRSVEVVYFVRDATELLLSSWQEHVKHGGARSFHEYASTHLTAPLASPLLNPCRVLDVYRTAFGDGSVRVIDYDVAKASGDIFEAFALAAACTGITALGAADRKNITMELWFAEFMRALNAAARSTGQLKHGNVRKVLLRLRRADPVMRRLLAEAQQCISASMLPFSLRGSEVERAARRSFHNSYPCVGLPWAAETETSFRDRGVPSGQWLCAPEGQTLLTRAFRRIRAAL